MKRKIFNKRILFVLIFLICLVISLSTCGIVEEYKYYSRKENYINATGIVVHIAYTEDNSELYLGFSDLSPKFDDVDFKIVGDNLLIVQRQNIDEKIKIGDEIDFITAPKYFGDGYVMPIVAIIVAGEELLSFEEGYANLLKWLVCN